MCRKRKLSGMKSVCIDKQWMRLYKSIFYQLSRFETRKYWSMLIDGSVELWVIWLPHILSSSSRTRATHMLISFILNLWSIWHLTDICINISSLILSCFKPITLTFSSSSFHVNRTYSYISNYKLFLVTAFLFQNSYPNELPSFLNEFLLLIGFSKILIRNMKQNFFIHVNRR